MQKGFAPIIVLLMVLLVASTAGVTYYFTKSQTLLPKLQSISQPQSTPTPIIQLQDNFSETTENNYINKQMGISLTIPFSWQGKYKDELLVADPSEDLKIGSLMTVNFVYLGSKQKYTLFSIHQFPVQDWKRKGFTERKLGEKDNYVYYYTYSLDNPFIGIEADEYQSMSADINKILSTFEFLDKDSNKTNSMSSDENYIVTEERQGDYNKIYLKDRSGRIISTDIVVQNTKELGLEKIGGMYGVFFSRWNDNQTFTIKVVTGNGKEQEYLINAESGKVIKTI